MTPAQLEACDGLDNGAPCSVLFGEGTCVDAACEISRCGDGSTSSTEVCDDGNRADGDGCRGDCLSDETCGNGAVDPGERCDCGGDEATRPVGCATTNSDDPTALCDLGCSRYCGDGSVTGAETCDGTNVPLACIDFGFYYGEVACSPFCSFDRTACTGRCGDTIVQSDQGEQCDGALPANTSCLSYGADYGHLSCTGFCTADVAQDCHRFGWETVFQGVSSGGFLQGAALNEHGVMARNFDLVHVTYDGAVVERLLSDAGRILATDDEFVVISPTIAARYGASGWTDFATPPHSRIAADGAYIYTLTATCTVERIEVATWSASTLPASGLTTCTSIDVLGGAVLIGGADRIAAYAGSWRVRTGFTGVTAVGWRDGSHAYVHDSGSHYFAAIDTKAPPVLIGPTSGTLVTSAQGDALDISGVTARITQGLLRVDLPGTPIGYARAADGGFLRYDRTVQRLRPLYQTVDFNPFLFAFQPQPDGSVAVSDESEVRSYGAGVTITRPYDSVGMGYANAILGPVTGEHFLGTSSPDFVFRYDTGTSAYVQELALTATIVALIADGTGTPWVATGYSIHRRVTGTWVMASHRVRVGRMRGRRSPVPCT